MIKVTTAIGLSLLLIGCAAAPEKTASIQSSGPSSDPAAFGINADDGERADRSPAGRWAVAVIGTPFYLAFKTVVCGASLAIAAPTAAVVALSDTPYGMGVDTLGDGVAANCGPPYVLSPS